ncbi:MAG: TraI domain-containing protein [Rickettsiella sp.]|nr:TraI domain-containing protein [Rickettsiella sp.]
MVLFQGLKRHLQSQNKKNNQLFGIYPIKKAVDLLSTTENQIFVKTIKSLIKPSSYFAEFYFPALEKFAEFVQNIPENQRDFFGYQTEFLTHGLERVSRTLSLCLNHFFPEKVDFSNISKHDALWIYATFSAALFLDIGKLAVKYMVMLYHEKAYPLKKWDPYASTMLGQGGYYKFDYVKENFNNLRQFVTPILARQILDSITECQAKSGFNWIASDSEVLEAWFALLTGEEDRIPMTSFMSMIPRAEIEIVENYRKKIKVSTTDPAGEAFLQWLRKEIKEGRITINGKDAKIHVTEKEILLCASLFQTFAHANSSYKHPEIIERQFVDVAKLYQIPINGFEQQYREKGYRTNRTIGGITAIRANEEKLPMRRFLKGGIGLLSFIRSQPLHKETYLGLPQNIIKHSIFPKLTT